MATIQRRNPLIKTVRQLSDEEWERLYCIDITRAYQLWYTKAFVVVCQFLPWRADDFRSLYEFPSKNRSELTAFNYRVADLLRGFGLPNGVNWKICYSLIKAQCDILESVKAFIEPLQAHERPVPQADTSDIASPELVTIEETVPAPSRKKKRRKDDPESRDKGKIETCLNDMKYLADLKRRHKQGEDVREEVTNHIREMAVQFMLG